MNQVTRVFDDMVQWVVSPLMRIRKNQPTSSNVHVPSTEWKVRKDSTMNPPIDNLQATMLNAAFGQPMFPTGTPQAQPRPSQPIGGKPSQPPPKSGTIKPDGSANTKEGGPEKPKGASGKANPIDKGGPGSGPNGGGGGKTTAEHEAHTAATGAAAAKAEKTMNRAITAHDENPTPANAKKEKVAREAHLAARVAHENQLKAHIEHLKSKVGKATIQKADFTEIHPTEAPEGGRRVATLAVKHGDKLLMGKRRDNGKWTTPGGHVEDGEDMHSGALRELHEETGMVRLKARHIKPLSKIHKLTDRDGKPLHVQPFVVETEKRHNTTMKNDPDGEVERWHWVDTANGLPEEIVDNLHVPGQYNCLLQALGLVEKDMTQDNQMNVEPNVNKDDGGNDETLGGLSNNSLGLYDMQQIIAGTDWELGQANQTIDADTAKELALTNLQDDPEYYRKKYLEVNNPDDTPQREPASKDTRETQQDPNSGMGLNLDIGSGQARQPGHIGLDLYPYDHGTLVHDVHLGLPFEDGSAQNVRLVNSLHEMDDLSDDPKPLLAEIQRVLMPGGQFHYEGPNQIYNYPEWLNEDAHEVGVAKGNEGVPEWHKQTFTRQATPDAATANDAEPRIGISQYDQLPADALLAMDALGYYWSDATTSGRGNRLHGYPSQGALVQKKASTKKAKVVGKDWITINGAHIEPDKGMGATHALHGKGKDKGKHEGKHEGKHQTGHAAHAGHGSSHEHGGIGEMLAQGLEHLGERAEKSAKPIRKSLVRKEFVPIMKLNKAKQIVYGVVLSPDELDLQDDLMTADDIEQTAHEYLEKSRVVGSGHEKPIAAYPVESYIAPQDIEWTDSQYGPQKIKKGAWVLGVKVCDPKEWQKVITGDYAGFSVGGMGLRDPLN